MDEAVSWGLLRARTVLVRTLDTVFFWAGAQPSDDDDDEMDLRPWPPTPTERRAIDAAHEPWIEAVRAALNRQRSRSGLRNRS